MCLGRMGGGPDVRLTSFDGEFALAQKFVADHEAGFFPFRHAGFRKEFVSVFGRDEKTRVRFDQRNADYTMRFEKFVERESGCSEESRCALIEPAKVVRKENNVGGITIAKLNSDSNAVYEHKLLRCETRLAASLTRCRVICEMIADSIERPFSFARLILRLDYSGRSKVHPARNITSQSRLRSQALSLSSIIRILISPDPTFSTVCGGSGCNHWAHGVSGGSPASRLSKVILPCSFRRMKWLKL